MASVKLSNGATYTYTVPWNPSRLFAGGVETPIAFDTETRMIDEVRPFDIPELALATVSNLNHSAILKPDQIGPWILAHHGQHIVGHNLSFDFWVVDQHLRRRGEHAAADLWWDMVEAGRMHDTLILDQLISLATQGPRRLPRRNLAVVAKQECKLELDKEDPYRVRYGELIDFGFDHGHTEPGFWEYAIKDSIVTAQVYRRQFQKAKGIMGRLKEMFPKSVEADALKKHGPLTETIQLKGSIALQAISRIGIRVDLKAAAAFVDGLRKASDAAVATMQEHAPEVLVYTDQLSRSGVVSKTLKETPFFPGFPRTVATTKRGAVRVHRDRLVAALEKIAERMKKPVPQSCGKLGGTSISAKEWKHFRDDPFISSWSEASKLAKVLGYASPLISMPIVQCRYNPLMVTGRTSASKPNLQQLPRTKEFRELFIARAGYKLFTVDYAFIELRTLASVCERRFGKSILAQVVRDGGDPHAYTAAAIQGMSLEAFMELKKTDPKRYAAERQAAKACYHPDVEALTPQGWKKISSLTSEDQVAQFWPGFNTLEFVRPNELTVRHERPLVRVSNESIDLRVTPDHRMLGYRSTGSPVVCTPAEMNNLMRGIWNAGEITTGRRLGALDEKAVRQVVCIQADGSYQGKSIRFGFTKQRKIDRFRELFSDVEFTEAIHSGGVTAFRTNRRDLWQSILTEEKVFRVDRLLTLPLSFRKAFVNELEHWDGHTTTEKCFQYFTTVKENADAVQAVATSVGYKSSSKVEVARTENRSNIYRVSIKRRNHTRGDNFQLDELPGMHTVHCLSVPSSFLVVRDGGKVVICGNCNFGIPGGLGADKLASYAQASYGVKMTVEEAADFRRKLTEEVYPELRRYLSDDTLDALAWNLRLPVEKIRQAIRAVCKPERCGAFLRVAAKVLKGDPHKKDGTPYSDKVIDQVWSFIQSLAAMSSALLPQHRRMISSKKASFALERMLLGSLGITPTGRIRSGCSYTQAKNCPFQGLAADGAKLALWTLVKDGYRVVGFVHDEVIVELPADKAKEESAQVETILVKSMESVLGKVPAAVEGHLGDKWTK